MKKSINTNKNYKPKQLKLPLEIEKIIKISDPVYNFCEIVDNIDLESYFVVEGNKVTGRPRYSPTKLLKIILFSFMRVKKDYMGNDQLLPAYNIQAAVCDEYIATIDVKQYASDMDCFIPLMDIIQNILQQMQDMVHIIIIFIVSKET